MQQGLPRASVAAKLCQSTLLRRPARIHTIIRIYYTTAEVYLACECRLVMHDGSMKHQYQSVQAT